MSFPETYGPRDQHNHGPGTFVGRDSYKFEMVDAKTKATLEKLCKEAPALGKLLSKALHDGVISPDTVAALENAVRSINEDVANVILQASHHINEDVANQLLEASWGINETVAHGIAATSFELTQTIAELDRVAGRFQGTSGVIDSTSANVDGWERVTEAMDNAAQNLTFAAQEHRAAARGSSRNSFLWGVCTCFVAVVTLLALWTFALHK